MDVGTDAVKGRSKLAFILDNKSQPDRSWQIWKRYHRTSLSVCSVGQLVGILEASCLQQGSSSSAQIFTKFGEYVYWANSLNGIVCGFILETWWPFFVLYLHSLRLSCCIMATVNCAISVLSNTQYDYINKLSLS